MMKEPIFREQYRVVSVESERLIIQGVHSGEVLTIICTGPENALRPEDYPPGQLIALSNPGNVPPN